jgi:hypothetical protein
MVPELKMFVLAPVAHIPRLSGPDVVIVPELRISESAPKVRMPWALSPFVVIEPSLDMKANVAALLDRMPCAVPFGAPPALFVVTMLPELMILALRPSDCMPRA